MKCTPRLLLALFAPFALAWSASGIAQNCDNGNAKYHQQLSGTPVSCSQADCHGNDPRGGKNGILNG